ASLLSAKKHLYRQVKSLTTAHWPGIRFRDPTVADNSDPNDPGPPPADSTVQPNSQPPAGFLAEFAENGEPLPDGPVDTPVPGAPLDGGLQPDPGAPLGGPGGHGAGTATSP